ncbi:hypothetical protein BGZ54_005622 [Gamsiella multidivaricata]|nr:hypothetical protein BGZ54_005622 [Gamsiella multidivaricata]
MAKHLWRVEVKNLPHASYFESEPNPATFEHIRFLKYLQPTSADRRYLSNIWLQSIIPALKNSSFQNLQDAWKRLAKEWSSKAEITEEFRKQLGNEEVEKENQNRAARLKLAGEKRLRAAEILSRR